MSKTPKYDNATRTNLRVILKDGGVLHVAPLATFDVTLKNLVVNADGRTDIESFLESGVIVKHSDKPPEPVEPDTAGEGEVTPTMAPDADEDAPEDS